MVSSFKSFQILLLMCYQNEQWDTNVLQWKILHATKQYDLRQRVLQFQIKYRYESRDAETFQYKGD